MSRGRVPFIEILEAQPHASDLSLTFSDMKCWHWVIWTFTWAGLQQFLDYEERVVADPASLGLNIHIPIQLLPERIKVTLIPRGCGNFTFKRRPLDSQIPESSIKRPSPKEKHSNSFCLLYLKSDIRFIGDYDWPSRLRCAGSPWR